MTAPTLRDRLAKALRGKHNSSDSRPSYRAADALVPVVEDEIRRRGLAVADPDSLLHELDEARQRAEQAERERDEAGAALQRSRDALAAFDGRGVITLEGANWDIPTPAEIRDAWRASLDQPETT